MRKNKHKKMNVVNEPLTVDQELTPEEFFEVMVRGTAVSCKLTKVLTSAGSDPIGVCAAFYGLAKASVLLEQLALRYGYEMKPFYQDARGFWEAYCKTEEFEDSLKRIGFNKK